MEKIVHKRKEQRSKGRKKKSETECRAYKNSLDYLDDNSINLKLY